MSLDDGLFSSDSYSKYFFLSVLSPQQIWLRSYSWSRCRSLGNSLNAFCVVTSITSSTEIPFTWAIYSAAMEMFWGSFRTWNRTKQKVNQTWHSRKTILETIDKTEQSELVKTKELFFFFFLMGRLGEAGRQGWGEGPELQLKSYSCKAGLSNIDCKLVLLLKRALWYSHWGPGT